MCKFLRNFVLCSGDSKLTKSFRMRRYAALSLVEGLLILVGIGILVALVIVVINPAQKMAEQRNAQRSDEVTLIANAITEYAVANEGTLPQDIPVSAQCEDDSNEICRTGAVDCNGKVELNALTREEEFLTAIPIDPQEEDLKGT